MPLAPLLHDLALLSLALAYGTDHDLARAELAAIYEQLEAWAPGEDPALVENALREATLSYGNGLDGGRLQTLLDRLRDALSPEERDRVLDDLRALASADGTVQEEESTLVARVASAWAA